MDFIKTSSLRALIELTFQRNWNGLIWMSRKGVITKRVKTVQTALSRISAQPRSPAGRGTNVPLGQIIRPSEVSAKVQTTGRYASRPGKHVPRSATPHHSHRARPCARAGKQASRPRASRVPRPMRPSRERRPASGREHRPTSSVRPQRPTTNPSGHDRSDRPSHDRPTPRSTRSPF
ncbi:unnamed protein product [Microthlaspi erraticum]|uniref:Uncharacterized protein n=1 Tax=Microthlaspi erraticum TaxID=1685480 RepID=A0A6D2K5K4_9BRAS|nr:unnamed protein product [Microthlaspi erraticum]